MTESNAQPRSTPLIYVEASLIGGGLGIEPAHVQALLKDGTIATLCERGVGTDSGRYRVTFYYRRRRFRVVLDAAGTILDAPEQSAP